MITAVVTDLDGTIIRRDGSVSPATLRVARVLRTRGIPLIIATARTPPLWRLSELNADVALAVCCNGGIGFEPATNRQLWRTDIDPAALARLIQAIHDHLPRAGYGVRNGRPWTISDGFYAARGRWPGSDYRVGTREELAAVPATMMTVVHPELTPEETRRILVEAGIGPDAVTMSIAGDELLDITPAHTDKGTGLARAFERLGVDPRGVMAFGDAANDLPMFEVAGHAVAMANGTEEARAAADAIAGSVDDDGFAGYLDQLGLLDVRRTSRL